MTEPASSRPQARPRRGGPPSGPSVPRRAGQSPPSGPATGYKPRLTGRAAILAIVLCAIALSLAYPVREYLAQRRLIAQLKAQAYALSATEKRLRAQQRRLADPAYIERLARDRLHMCAPGQRCYVIIGPGSPRAGDAGPAQSPWYARLWSSVQQADRIQAGRHQQVPSKNGPHAHRRRQ